MAGVEAVVGGAFVSAIIKTVVDTGRSYFSDKYKMHRDTQEMLDSLEVSLPRIQLALKLAEQMSVAQDEVMATWQQQLKDVAYEAEDVMDDFQAKRILDTLKNNGKVSKIAISSARSVKSWILSDSDEKKLKSLVKKIDKICNGVGDFIEFIKARNKSASDGSIGFSRGETSHFLSKTKKIFGRDNEIELILDMIITERQDRTESVGKNNVIQSTADFNLMQNTSDVIANTLKEIKENISEKGKEKADTSDSFGVTEENVNPIEQRFSSTNLDQPSVGDARFPSNQSIISLTIDAPSGKNSDAPSSGDGQFPITDKIHAPLVSKEPKLSDATPPASKKPEPSDWTARSRETLISVGEPSIGVLPIVGIGGIGKTTIAQVIYNHSEVTEYFDLKGWVYVRDSAEPKTFFDDILCSFDRSPSKSIAHTSLSHYHEILKDVIHNKRFLLIFDDVREGKDWINSTWKKLIEVLAEGVRGSMIIVTTASTSVAARIGTLPPVSIGYLPPRQFLGLFEYFAFGHNLKKCYLEQTDKNENHYFPLTQHEETVLKPIGEKISEKLHGLPLAAEVIGTLLSGKTESEYWNNVLESDWWNHDVSKDIIAPLGVSYQNLDPDLKQSFIYCSLFPKNYVFDKDRLVQMWIAHGFIHPTVKEKIKLESGEIKIEDIGRCKFDKLVDGFFFQSAIIKNKYVMHDLIREFAIAISSEMLYFSGNHLKANKKIPPIRHMAIDFGKDDDVYIDDLLWHDENVTILRTVMFFGFCKMSSDEHFSCILEKLVKLRLLDLSYFFGQITLPNIGNLSHLRFLDLSFSGISKIPKSLCDLVHLQVLDLRGLIFSHLPPGMNRLINLRHLYASPFTVSLIHGIGRLTNLQELEEFRVRDEEGFTISELSNLTSLNGQLTLRDLQNIPSKEKAITAKLEKKNCLVSLILFMGLGFNSKLCAGSAVSSGPVIEEKYPSTSKFDMTPCKGYMTDGYLSENNHHHHQILEGLKPHKNIRELSIQNFAWVSFPSWVMDIHEMNNLRRIELVECFHLETLPPLGSLPSLEFLSLSGLESITCIEKEFYGTFDVIFPSLRELTFQCMGNWEIWSDPGERKHFPCLQKLKIESCLKLSEIPLHSLKQTVELHLSRCDMVTKNVRIYFSAMNSLTRLYLCGSEMLKIDLSCDNLRELRVLSLRTINIGQLEGQISSLVNLKKLSFFDCSRKSIDRQHLLGAQHAKNMDNLPSLARIEVWNSNRIPEVLFRLGIPSLRTLCMFNYASEFTSSENSWLQQLSSLEYLELSNCYILRCLPSCISTLSSLKKFSLNNCPKIRSLPEEGLPRSLMELHIIDCSYELAQGCQENTGAEWSKISHVPFIRVKSNPDHWYRSRFFEKYHRN